MDEGRVNLSSFFSILSISILKVKMVNLYLITAEQKTVTWLIKNVLVYNLRIKRFLDMGFEQKISKSFEFTF